ncbi:MAG: PDZ domain-containing protein [Rhodovibrio sp.]|nr:PDZ domain-containing protein [Rhodovibrio sp.]
MALRSGDRRLVPGHDEAGPVCAAQAGPGGRTRGHGRLRRSLRRGLHAVAVALALFLVAAAGTDQRAIGSDYNAYQASRLFAAGYNDIAKIYIDDVAVPALALDGLGALSTLDRDIGIVRTDGEIVVKIGGRRVGSYHVPAPRDMDAWGAVTAGVIDLALRSSDELPGYSTEDIYARVFDGMLQRLDGYSRYAGPEAAQQNRASRDGFGGIGARVRARDEGIAVISVRDGSPADRAGLAAGDTIVAIDGTAAVALSQREAIQRLRGHVDSTLALTVRPESGPTTRTLRLRRAHIVPKRCRRAPTAGWR